MYSSFPPNFKDMEIMTTYSESQILHELVPVLEQELNRHLAQSKDWMPHRIAAGDTGSGSVHPGAQAALVLNLLTEDNLPSYHRAVSQAFSASTTGDESWRAWIDIWTAEESRHALAMRDYLLHSGRCNDWFDSDDYERRRMSMMRRGWHPTGKSPLRFLIYVSVQELATRISHRRTGQISGDPMLDRLLTQVASDENLHMILYRNLVSAALDLEPILTVKALEAELLAFEMPGSDEERFRSTARRMASLGIYNLRIHHDEVVLPLMRFWRLPERDLPVAAEESRTRIAAALALLDAAADRQQDKIEQARHEQPIGVER